MIVLMTLTTFFAFSMMTSSNPLVLSSGGVAFLIFFDVLDFRRVGGSQLPGLHAQSASRASGFVAAFCDA